MPTCGTLDLADPQRTAAFSDRVTQYVVVILSMGHCVATCLQHLFHPKLESLAVNLVITTV